MSKQTAATTYPTTVRLTAEQRAQAYAIGRVNGARRAGVIARAVEIGLEVLERQLLGDQGR